MNHAPTRQTAKASKILLNTLLEKHLSATCTAPRAMLSKARQDAVKLDDPKAHEKTLRTLFESLAAGAQDSREIEVHDPK